MQSVPTPKVLGEIVRMTVTYDDIRAYTSCKQAKSIALLTLIANAIKSVVRKTRYMRMK